MVYRCIIIILLFKIKNLNLMTKNIFLDDLKYFYPLKPEPFTFLSGIIIFIFIL